MDRNMTVLRYVPQGATAWAGAAQPTEVRTRDVAWGPAPRLLMVWQIRDGRLTLHWQCPTVGGA